MMAGWAGNAIPSTVKAAALRSAIAISHPKDFFLFTMFISKLSRSVSLILIPLH
jgi:hypothetical protein